MRKVGLARGRAGSDQELAIITSQLRRRISAATIRANYTCLMERMAQVGEGAGRAENRRGWVRMEEEKKRRDREAGHGQGKGCRAGTQGQIFCIS